MLLKEKLVVPKYKKLEEQELILGQFLYFSPQGFCDLAEILGNGVEKKGQNPDPYKQLMQL